jgi:hypothetical protein
VNPQQRLDDKGIPQQRNEGTRIRGPVKRIRFSVSSEERPEDPRLSNYGCSREHNKRQGHPEKEKEQDGCEGRVRVCLSGYVERKDEQRDRQKEQMPGPDFCFYPMSVEISQKEHGLKKHEACHPYMGRTAEIGCEETSDQRFHGEEKDSAKKDHGCYKEYCDSVLQ